MPTISKVRIEDVRSLEESIKSIVESEVRKKGYDAVIVRDILPTDDLNVGTNNAWVFSFAAAGWQTLINKTLPEDTAIAFYGVRVLDPNVDLNVVRFKLGAAKVKTEFQIQKALNEEDRTAYFEEVVLYKPTEVMIVEGQASSNGDKKVILLGFIAEPKGKRIIGSE